MLNTMLYLLMQAKHQYKDLKKQRHFYSGKKKRHTLKSQIVVDKAYQKIICLSFSNGKRHDFRLFKESDVRFKSGTEVLTDTGYQGIKKIHGNSSLPKKRTKKCPLTKEERIENKTLSSQRVLNENVAV